MEYENNPIYNTDFFTDTYGMESNDASDCASCFLDMDSDFM